MGLVNYLLIFILTFLLVITGYIAYNLYLDSKEFRPGEYIFEENKVYSNTSQFYPNMRFPQNKISYSISSSCTNQKINNIIDAIDIIQHETLLEFYRVKEGAEIEYTCSALEPESGKEKYFIAGEGGPREIIDTGLFNVILTGKVSLYREEKCQTPNVAIHETFHVLGFDHNDNPKSIMYPVTGCDLEIDEYIIEQINELYSIISLPDLAITRVVVNREGNYVDFETDINNRGLKKSEEINLEIYADNKLIKSYDIESLGIGYIRKISVTNLKVPRESKFIEFVVSIKNDTSEIDFSNNKVSVEMKEV